MFGLPEHTGLNGDSQRSESSLSARATIKEPVKAH